MVLDLVAALAICVLLVAAVNVTHANVGLAASVGYGLAAVLSAAVAVRRRWPRFALGIALATSAASVLGGFTRDPLVALALTLYTVAVVSSVRAAWGALILTQTVIVLLAVAAWAFPVGGHDHVVFASRVVTASLVQLLAWLLGRAAANQRSFNELTAEYHEHRFQEQAALAQATVAQAEHAVVHERLRIAQELHDVVAHSMSVIAVQAGVGHHIAAEQPDKAAAALAAIEGASRDALQEMRRLLGVLRGPEELVPAPGLADLPALAQATARAGVEVDLRLEGAERVLPAGLELTAYRIVQEALTNVVKHAGTNHSRVVVTYQPRHLLIEVTDDGRGPEAPRTAGSGLLGMRERVAAYDGRLIAEALPQRGFRVSALLPLNGEP